MMNTLDRNIRRILLNRMDLLDINQKKLSEISGVSQSTLSNYLQYDSDATTTIHTLSKICAALRLSLTDLFSSIEGERRGYSDADYPMFQKYIFRFLKDNDVNESHFQKEDFDVLQRIILYISDSKMDR